jgi:hypothetical protein
MSYFAWDGRVVHLARPEVFDPQRGSGAVRFGNCRNDFDGFFIPSLTKEILRRFVEVEDKESGKKL